MSKLMFTTDDLRRDYRRLLTEVSRSPVVSPRGLPAREVRPLVVELTSPQRCIVKRRGFSRSLMWMEIAQLLAGEYHHDLYRVVSPQAAQHITPYGAYGPRVREQLLEVERELQRDPDSRRAVVYVGRPDDLRLAAAYGDADTVDMPCIVEGTLVSGLQPLAATKRWYNGKVIQIKTCSGNQLTVTPNHPILTGRGWIAAKSLHEGDYVVSSSSSDQCTACQQDEHQVPARVEDVFDALLKTSNVKLRRRISVNDFHGDGGEGQVDVVAADGFLWLKDEPTFIQKIVELSFPVRTKSSGCLTGTCGTFKPCLIGGGNMESCIFSKLYPYFWGNFNARKSTSFLTRSQFNTIFEKKIFEPAQPVLETQIGNGCSLKVSADDLASQYSETGTRTSRSPLGQLDKVSDINCFDYHGHVYNLVVETGWYYSNNIIQHNCTLSWQFFKRNGALEMLVNMRSWDLVWGLSYDIPAFVSVQLALADALGLSPGTYTHVAGSGHLYERDVGMIEDVTEVETVDQMASVNPAKLPLGTVQRNAVAMLRSVRSLFTTNAFGGMYPGWEPAFAVWAKKERGT